MGKDRLEKLLAKREEMNAKIRREQLRDRSRQRRLDTRRKILAGALVLTEEDPAIQSWLARTIAKALTRDDERALFGLAPLPPEPPAQEQKARPQQASDHQGATP